MLKSSACSLGITTPPVQTLSSRYHPPCLLLLSPHSPYYLYPSSSLFIPTASYWSYTYIHSLYYFLCLVIAFGVALTKHRWLYYIKGAVEGDFCPFSLTHPSPTLVYILVLYVSDPPSSILMSLCLYHYVDGWWLNDSSIIDDYMTSTTPPNLVACPTNPSHPLVMYWSRTTWPYSIP
jgi:hypothetical protein